MEQNFHKSSKQLGGKDRGRGKEGRRDGEGEGRMVRGKEGEGGMVRWKGERYNRKEEVEK